MMSLSDKDNKQNTTTSNEWKPLDLNSIQHIDDERFCKKEKDKPDYNLFKLIYEDSQISDQDSFKFFYEPDVKITDSQPDTSHEFKEFFQEQEDDKKVNAIDEDKFRFTEDSDMGDETKFSQDPDINSGMNGIKASGLPDESGGDMSDHIKSDSGVNTETDNESGQDLRQNPKNDIDPDSGMESGRKGYEEGFKQGFEKGKEDGLIQGRAEGEKQGYAEGFVKGENEAKKACDAKAVEILSSLEDILLKADDAWKELVKKYENQIISLVCRIAEKVVLAKVKIDDNIVKQSIFQAMEKMPEPEEISLHISPDDYEYIEMIKDEFFDKVKGLTSVSIVSDPSVTRGGCRIESSKGKIETSIESRLEAVLSSIVKAGEL